MRTDGLLLAAGAGRRMGQPKALVRDPDGTSWLLRAVQTLQDGGCSHVAVVLGAAVEEPTELLDGTGASVIVATDWADGMSASLRAGLHDLDDAADAVVVTLVDLPDVSAAVVRRVLGGSGMSLSGVGDVSGLGGSSGVGDTNPVGVATLRRAAYQGTPGHPVVLGRHHWQPVIDSAVGDRGARDYLAQHDVELIECGDLATGRDVDSPH
ncbi:molybdenum cofactor cytidylyltransferase/nicotine blue oxidoreductase [Branchiibius hedensis]|uniref:Nicotine blue oxidoreductase n=1 Tax=Branchiibius hedensis TaxID=672460 RepID=A0A2Y8ZW56_9MICO|nr:nucleotidyltransferase family protein [Branchiibius hedensis]PWJ26687.1 molybdenum cofactor cytidylyltransferase/nicotine blue oxidoreductase [Branchiibius hedensis]SSA35498.1 nicotine blue oxidoreductase [Branchiibius hedensis]